MWIVYIAIGKTYTLRFKLGRKITQYVGDRINEIIQNTTELGEKLHTDIDTTEEEIPTEVQKIIAKKYESIESRLQQLKYYMSVHLSA